MSRTLKKSPNDNIGPRLKKLRTERNLSLSKVAKQLAPHVELQLAGKSGETRISAIENSGANLTLELAIAYSKVFDVSLNIFFAYQMICNMRTRRSKRPWDWKTLLLLK